MSFTKTPNEALRAKWGILLIMKDNKSLDNLRHSCAHLLAKTVLEMYPGSHNAIGPFIENGFYQDFDMGTHVISDADLPKIEERMRQILPSWTHFEFNEVTLDEARKLFSHNPYKIELLEEFATDGKKLLTNNPGNFLDLCKMGHIENPSQEMQHFKLLSVAGAYWRGSEKNKMLTRIYGTCWPTQKELDDYLNMLEESRKRDHRKLGKELDLFYFSDLVGPGLPLFTPKGTIIRRELEAFVQSLQEPFGYTRVLIPHLAKIELYEKSGHWLKYKDSMFQITSDDGVKFAMKPMNCPHHIELFSRKQFSYRELPQRYSEVTAVYRQEKAGELLGLSRVYMLTQDDAHVFCTEEQAVQESLNVYKIIKDFYAAFDFGVGMKVRLSLRDPNKSEKCLGNDTIWKKSEDMMREVARQAGLEVYEGVGEAAFYAPKLDFMAYDSLGREWQLATIQLDLNFADRFDLKYADKDGVLKRPVIIHRAILGSVERFMSILIEHYAGAFPLWLAPIQVVILPISDKFVQYAQSVLDSLKSANIRAELNDKNEPLNARIRDAEMQKIPYILVVGDKEIESESVSIRHRGQKESVVQKLELFTNKLKADIINRI